MDGEVVVLPWTPLGKYLEESGHGEDVYNPLEVEDFDPSSKAIEVDVAQRQEEQIIGLELAHVLFDGRRLVSGLEKTVQEALGHQETSFKQFSGWIGLIAVLYVVREYFGLIEMLFSAIALVITCLVYFMKMYNTMELGDEFYMARKLEKQTLFLEQELTNGLRVVKHCELNKRGYQLTRFVPPIGRIERNEWLLKREKLELECMPLRKWLIQLASTYRRALGDERVLKQPANPYLIASMEKLFKRVASARKQFYQLMCQGHLSRSELVHILTELQKLEKDCQNKDEEIFMAKKKEKMKQSRSCESISRKRDNNMRLFLEDVEAHLGQIQSTIFACKQRMADSTNSSPSAENFALLERQLQQLSMYKVPTFRGPSTSSSSSFALEESQDDSEDEDWSKHDAENEDPSKLDQDEDLYTAVFQGTVDPAFLQKVQNRKSYDDEFSLKENVNMLGELNQVLEYKKPQLAPEKIVREMGKPIPDIDAEKDNDKKDKDEKSTIPTFSLPINHKSTMMSELSQLLPKKTS